MSTIAVLPVVYRSYAPDRDWLDRPEPRKPSAQVVQFTQKLALCSVCSSPNHRASRCPARPGKQDSD